MELAGRVRIVNGHGLHARPCHAFVSACLASRSAVRVTFRDRHANGRSILEMMSLGAGVDDELEIAVDGPDAVELLERLCALVGGGFGEPQAP